MRSDAADNRARLIRATRDVVAQAGSLSISVRDISNAAGVSLATLYRHFEGKQALVDEVSIFRWTRMEALALQWNEDEEPVEHVLRILESYSRMTTADHRFIVGAGIQVGTKPVEHIRASFEPPFAQSWVQAQSSGHLRKNANPRDAIDMAGVIRDARRRVPMLAMLAGGICTDKVDVVGFASGAVSRNWK